MASNLSTYNFAPWRMRNGQYVVASEATWRKPARWNRGAADGRHRPRVLLTCDVFEDWTGPMVDSQGHRLNLVAGLGRIPWIGGSDTERPANVTMADVRARLFALIDATPNLDWILLTKRPENIARMLPKPAFDHAGWNGTLDGYWHQMDKPRPNLWVGTSVENQQSADERIPHLLKVPAAVRFLSCEPLLSEVNFMRVLLTEKLNRPVPVSWAPEAFQPGPRIHWVIVGGESGPGARPCRVEWSRDSVRQCKDAGVPCFVKQLGGNVITRNDMIEDPFNDGEKGWPEPDVEHNIHGFRESHQGADCRIKLHDKKGGDWDEWPADLRIREFPAVEAAS